MDFHLPELGEGIYEAELVHWLVKVGDPVRHGQGLMEVMTDKATMEVPAPFTGTITDLRAEPGQPMKVGEVVLSYTGGGPAEGDAEAPRRGDGETERRGDGETERPRERETRRRREAETVAASPASVKAAPSVRQMARKLGIDLARVQGSGPAGRILIEDLTAHHPRGLEDSPAGLKLTTHQPPQPDYGIPGTHIKLQGLRRKVAEHMVLAKRTIPHYTYVDECDVTEMVRLRESLREPYAQAGVKLTYLAFFIKAAASALKEVPIVNASLDETAGEIVLHNRYHIGIAVAVPGGLIVPVVRDADQKDLGQIAREVERLGNAAREGKTRLDDLRGSTFTITSIGGIGGLFSTPVIHHPEVAILGIGKVVKRPVFDAAGNVRPADIVYLSLSFDHRVVDGAVGAVFGNAIIRQLQKPAAMLVSER